MMSSLLDRRYPGIPLANYTVADIERELDTVKHRAPHCTIGCVHRASSLDGWRVQHVPSARPADGASDYR